MRLLIIDVGSSERLLTWAASSQTWPLETNVPRTSYWNIMAVLCYFEQNVVNDSKWWKLVTVNDINHQNFDTWVMADSKYLLRKK